MSEPGLAGLSVHARLALACAAGCCRPGLRCNLLLSLAPNPHLPANPVLQGPTVSQVYTMGPDGRVQPHLYAAVICVAKKQLYPAVKEIRKVRLGLDVTVVVGCSCGCLSWWGVEGGIGSTNSCGQEAAVPRGQGDPQGALGVVMSFEVMACRGLAWVARAAVPPRSSCTRIQETRKARSGSFAVWPSVSVDRRSRCRAPSPEHGRLLPPAQAGGSGVLPQPMPRLACQSSQSGLTQQCRVASVCLQVGGSGVLVQPMTYIFDEEPARWRQLLDTLGVDPKSIDLV